MNQPRRFRFALIGKTSLLTQAADELRARGHEAAGVVSPDARVALWARNASIPRYDSAEAMRAALGRVDYLLSISNDDILSPAVLAWPAGLAINYHDGPLPRYAGIHATSWALMAGETEHAATWHVMTNRVDAGDILAQEPFPIAPDDTAFSLNAKSFEAAQRAFKSVLDGIESGTVTRCAQDDARRTFFGRHRRPANACVLDWTAPAARTADLVRALDFGAYENGLAVPRLWTGERFLVPTAAAVEPGPNSAPGTIISSGPDWLRVAVADGDVRLTGLREIDGRPCNLGDDARFACARRLPAFSDAESLRLDADLHKHEAFWLGRLSTLQPIAHPLVSGKSKEAAAAHARRVEVPEPPAGVSRAEFAAAAFVLYLSRTSRAPLFDVPVHGAAQPVPRSAASRLFESHVPARFEVDAGCSFTEVMARVRAELGHVAANRSYARDAAIRFPALRSVAEIRDGHVWNAAIEIGSVPTRSVGLPGAITLRMTDSGCRLAFRDDLVPAATADAIAAQFQTLLLAAAAEPGAKASLLNLTPTEERRRVLEEFNRTHRAYETGVTLVDLIDRQVKAHPERTAVVFEGRKVSYAELDALANRLAHRLRALGIKPGMLVGVCLERSVELVAALVGVVKSGGAYVPLDPTYPPERIRNMSEDARLTVVVTREGELKKIGGWTGGTIVRMDDGSLDGQAAASPSPAANENDLAYCIFTSGSTGRPKGGMNAHKGIVNRLLWMQEAYQLAENDRVLQKTPYSFDVSVWEFFWPLITGASIVVAKPEGHKDSAYLVDLITREGVTVCHFVPSMLRVFVEERGVERCASLRRVACSGEALPFDLTQRFFDRLPWVKLANLYGPTEAAVDVTAWECRKDDPRAIVPIGAPIANTSIYVLDPEFNPTPVGIPGEVFLGGVQVGVGYANRPELTAERFLPDPFRAGGRMYRTGDLGRWLPDGTVEYLGRLDDQVKIRGFRIELGEIEQVLAAQDRVKEAVVLAREDVPGQKRLVAYIVGDGATAAGLKDSIARTLPDFMVPAAFVFLDRLPVTPNGKLDRRALPAPPRGSEGALARAFVAPATPVEQSIAAIWGDVLKLERVGVTDNFFEIGGDSIMGLRVVARARDANLHFAVHDLFRQPTIRGLAAHIASSKAAAAVRTKAFELVSDADRARMPGDVVDAYPLSALQGGMVFHSERSIGSYLYQVAMSIHVRAKLDLALLQRAVNRVVSRHPILRTSFDLGNFGEPLQLVHRTADARIVFHDISHVPAARQNELLGQWIDDEAEHRFDWNRWPLLKYTVHKRGPENFQFGITFHDAILDGWSTSNMMTEIFERYLTMLRGGADTADAPNAITYRDFVATERETLKSDEARKFWVGMMDGAPFTAIPRLPDVGHDSAPARNLDVIVPIPAEVNAACEEHARKLGLPIKSFYLAAHHRILGLLAQQDEVVGGLVMNGRLEEPGGDRSLGNHLNTMPYRLHVGGKTWAQLAKAAYESELRALPHRRYIGAQLLRDLGRAGLDNMFETGFNYTWFHVYKRLAGQKDFELLRVDFTDPFHYAFVANFRVDAFDDRLDVVLNYNTKAMTAEQVKRIGRLYQAAMRSIARSADEPADASTIVPESEREYLAAMTGAAVRAFEVSTLGGGEARAVHVVQADAQEEAQRILAAVFADVLRLPAVGPRDNFFEIGGDSILSIQICARARRQGVLITPNQVFDHPTIAELVKVAQRSHATEAEQGPVTGEAPLIPIQSWLLAQPLVNANQWNAAIVLEVPGSHPPEVYQTALRAIVAHHDALRARFSRAGGSWSQSLGGVDAGDVAFVTHAVAAFDTPEAVAALEQVGGKLQASLDLASGPVFGAALFREQNGPRSRLLMVAHHLVLDGLSWRIIVEDLIAACGQAARGENITFQPKTNSVRDWGQALQRHAARLAASAEAEWWAQHASDPMAEIVPDNPEGENVESSATVFTASLNEERTSALLHTVPAAYGSQINDVLLAALALAFRDRTGAPALRLDLMGHGREDIGEDLDVSRTVGWLTSLFPVVLDVNGSASADAAIDAVRTHLRRIPGRGIGFGLIRSLAPTTPAGATLAGVPQARMSFNYLGQFDQALAPGWSLRMARTRCGPTRDPASPRAYLLEVDAMVVGGRLVVDWTFSKNLFRGDTIHGISDAFMDWLTRIIDQSAATAGVAESFPLAGLSDEGLARLSALFESSEGEEN